ncbi:MAG: heme ABC exporter ATP-binding protein CcmA [Deinococcales bacterium]
MAFADGSDSLLQRGGGLALELSQLSKHFGRSYILKDISLTMRQGQLVALHGQNGSGKTTLLNILATRLKASQGSAKVLGFDVLKEAEEVRRRTAYVQVWGGSYPSLSALENLQFAQRLYQRKGDVGGVLEQVGLSHATHKLVRSYSSGMKKRLAIAKLLLSDASLWLLDEPYVALDEAGRELIDQLLLQAKQQGKTIILASHDLERSERYADSILQLKEGQLLLYPSIQP